MLKKLSALLLALALLTATFAAAETTEPAASTEPIAERKTIAPFVDLTWEEVALYGEAGRNMTATERYTSAWEYRVTFMQFGSDLIYGTIHAEKENYLQYVWRNLGQECIRHFTTCEQRSTSNADELAVYDFTDDQTYMRFSYVSPYYEDYIMFIIIHSEE